MATNVCRDFNLYELSCMIRYNLDRDPDPQLLLDTRSLMERCVMASQSEGPECATARGELKEMMTVGWQDRWIGPASTFSVVVHGPGGPKLAKISDMISAGKLEEAKSALLELAQDLPPERTL